jgi:phosphoribosyl 1,2-cyclic phosphodiesterase
MSLFVASLNSGSNGNCYYVGNCSEAVLVDAGISCKETEIRLKRAGLSFSTIKAIFISHEHIDHIRGVERISKKHNIPVFISPDTHKFSRLKIEDELLNNFSEQEPVMIGSLCVNSFRKNHDAADPYSFTISSEGVNVGVFTDIGEPCNNLKAHFNNCHAAFLEANYDEEMLETGRYPVHLKKRIRGMKGHLSNDQALALFLEHRASYLSHIFLSHLSKENNCPELVQKLFHTHANGVHVSVASRYKESEVFTITGDQHSIRPAKAIASSLVQASLF